MKGLYALGETWYQGVLTGKYLVINRADASSKFIKSRFTKKALKLLTSNPRRRLKVPEKYL